MKKSLSTNILPPGPKGLPIVGNIFQFQRNPLRFFRETQKHYPRMATIYMGKDPLVLCFRPKHIRYILVEHPRNFVKPNRGGFNLKALLGDGLLTIDGDFHRQQRRLVQPAFHKQRVEGYATIMVQFAQEMLEEWQVGSEVNISQEMQFLTLRIIAKALFNIDSRTQVTTLGQAFNQVINNPRRPFNIFERLGLSSTRKQKWIAGKTMLDSFVYDLIEQRRATGHDTGDVLSMLLAAQDDGIRMMVEPSQIPSNLEYVP